jgi:cytochrome oxidase assembly protein ShyY1
MSAGEKAARHGWRPGWKLTLFVSALLPVLLALGFWQLQRGEEKSRLLASEAALRTRPALSLESVPGNEAQRYQPVWLEGTFLAGQDFLLDNQRFMGRFGYEVISPFRLRDSGSLVLVSRGWIEGSMNRQVLPVVDTLAVPTRLAGEIYIPLGKPYLLAEQQWQAAWPKVIQAMDMDLATDALGEPPYPYVVRLAAGSPAVLQRHWQVVNLPPGKHTAYAVQWFSMAAVLLVLYILTGFGRFGRRPA